MNDSNREQLIIAARLLRPLLGELVFVGGTVTGLLITDEAAAGPRTTLDVDAIAEITSYAEYAAFGDRLRALGFREDTREGAPLCRWVHHGTTLDVMPLDEKILGFSNRWYRAAMESSVTERLSDDLEIRIVTGPFFIATKLEAFKGAGRGTSSGSRMPAALNRLADGWQVSNVLQYQSGAALGFGNSIFSGQLQKIPLPAGERTISRWFNIDAGFETNSQKQLGPNIRTLPSRFSGVRGAGLNNWDLSLVKITKIGEKLNLHFRSEFINAFNHAQFGDPNTSPSSTAFGRVTTETSVPRTIQFTLKLVF